jgi:carbon-monoxide dehydrogenase small subunit
VVDARAVTVTVDGRARTGLAEPRLLLSDFLRHELGLSGVHVGCEQGGCGACTVLLDGRLTLSCLTLAVQVGGAIIDTVEGLERDGELHPVQRAFQACHGLQCGFCTPGMLLTAHVLLEQTPDPTDTEIREYLSGNVCRCTGYAGIVASVREAARLLRGDGS